MTRTPELSSPVLRGTAVVAYPEGVVKFDLARMQVRTSPSDGPNLTRRHARP